MIKYPRYIVLLLTTKCNLKCAYCYRGDKYFFQEIFCDDSRRMSRAVIKKILLHAGESGMNFHIQLTGGEPTLEPELIKWTGDLIQKHNFPASIGIQTNGTLIDTFMIKLFKKYNIEVGVSLDGSYDIQEKLRGRSDLTFKGLKLLSDSRFPFQVTCVVTEHNAINLDQLALLLGSFTSVRGIGFDLLVCKGRAVKGDCVYPCSKNDLKSGIKKFMQALAYVNKKRLNPIKIRELETLKRSYELKKSTSFCYALTDQAIAVHPDGRVYPCAQLIDDPVFVLGNTVEEALTYEQQYRNKDILKTCTLENDYCASCSVFGFCPGDCPARLYYNDDDSAHLACVMYQTMWEEYNRHEADPDWPIFASKNQRF